MFAILILLFALTHAQDVSLPQSDVLHALPIRHPDCPTFDVKDHPVMLKYPNNCNKYYSCLNGYAYVMTCPNNLHWSQITYRCDYPEVAQCTDTLPQLPPLPLPLPLPFPQTPPEVVYQADLKDCQQYFQCQRMRCPANMLWSNRLQRCDLPYLSECSVTDQPIIVPPKGATMPTFMPPIASTPPATPGSIIDAVTEPTVGGLTPALNELDKLCSQHMGAVFINYPGDCHRFIQCNGVAYVNTCPGNLYWNSMLKTCDRYCI